MRSKRGVQWWLAALVLAFAPSAFAYTIVLKSGATIEAARKYSIRPDGKAVVVLPSGTTQLIEVSAIDVKKTEEVNRAGDDSVVVVDASRPGVKDSRPKSTLQEMHESRARPSEAARPPATRDTPLGVPRAEKPTQNARRPFGSVTIAAEITNVFRTQGVEDIEIYQGSDGRRPLAKIETANEAAVFRALEAGAQALIAVRKTSPEMVSTLELDLATSAGDRAGQFVMTPEQAQDLIDGRIDPPRFFVKYVQF